MQVVFLSWYGESHVSNLPRSWAHWWIITWLVGYIDLTLSFIHEHCNPTQKQKRFPEVCKSSSNPLQVSFVTNGPFPTERSLLQKVLRKNPALWEHDSRIKGFHMLVLVSWFGSVVTMPGSRFQRNRCNVEPTCFSP